MIFRVAVCVLKSEQYPFLTDDQRAAIGSFDAYKAFFGVNAPDVSTAVACVATALSSAVDEDGRDLGGILLEAHAVRVTASEFRGYEKYFLEPPDHRGIFYVSGRTHYSIPCPRLSDAAETVRDLKAIPQNPEVPSPPSFVFRRFREEAQPRNCRLLCPVCGAWKEHDSTALMYSFFDGLHEADPEKHRLGRAAAAKAVPFVEEHLKCLLSAAPR